MSEARGEMWAVCGGLEVRVVELVCWAGSDEVSGDDEE